MHLNFERLRTLWLVSELGTLVATARHLGVTPSAISQQLSQLEENIGADLLFAEGRGVALTPIGKALAVRGGSLVASLEDAGALAEELLAVTTGSYRISSIPTAALSVVRHAVLALGDQHPDLALSVVSQDPASSIANLRNRTVDLGIVDVFDTHPWVVPEDLTSVCLGQERMQLFVPSSMSPERGPMDLRTLADADWICSLSFASYADAVKKACRDAGFEPRVRWETDDIFLMQRYVADGFGVALHPPFSSDEPPPGVVVRAVADNPIEREIRAVSRASSTGRPIHQAVVEALQQAAVESFSIPQSQATAVVSSTAEKTAMDLNTPTINAKIENLS